MAAREELAPYTTAILLTELYVRFNTAEHADETQPDPSAAKARRAIAPLVTELPPRLLNAVRVVEESVPADG